MTSLSDERTIPVQALLSDHVKLRDIEELRKKLQSVREGGIEKLQIITDYDLTITKHHVNGALSRSSFGLLALCETLSPDFCAKNKSLREKYLPIESNPMLPRTEKIPYMIEWYTESERMYDGVVISPDELKRVVKKSLPELRDGFLDMYRLLEKQKVPVLVLSAGLGDVIKTVLTDYGINESDSFHIVSNFFKRENDKIRGFGCHENGQFIHPFNKNAIGCYEYFKNRKDKPNVILMGDSIGDANMDDGVPCVENVLKIGFLYGSEAHVNDALPDYMKHFDIVLIDDQTMKVPRGIIDFILSDK